jgi:predicted transposase/invertase (TIGR01784 family)
MVFVDPRNDLAFKKIFGDKNKSEILISFLNAILEFEGDMKIVSITLDNPYQMPDIEELKETILDIKARNQRGESFIVEMQKKDLGNFAKRSLYYTSKAYVSQINNGIDYKSLKKVYYISVVNFNMFENREYISRHLIINQETGTQDLEDFEFTFIELEKFDKKLDELETDADKWIFFIKNASNLDLIPSEFANVKEFKEAFEIANKFSWGKNELDVYDYMCLKEADEKNAYETALTKGKKKFIEQGVKQGIKQGIEKGENSKALKVAKKMILRGDSNDDITEITELSIGQIQELRNSLKYKCVKYLSISERLRTHIFEPFLSILIS